MNKNVVKVGLLIAMMMMSGLKCGDTEKDLKDFENQIYPNIGYVSVFKNMFRLDAHADDIAKLLNVHGFNNLNIERNNPLYARKQALAPFFSSDQNNQVKALADACKAKRFHMGASFFIVVAGILGYFYSKNK